MCGIVDKGPCEIVFLWVELLSLCEGCSGLRARLRSLYPEKRIVIRGLHSPHTRSFINHQKSSVVQNCSERAIRHTILPSPWRMYLLTAQANAETYLVHLL